MAKTLQTAIEISGVLSPSLKQAIQKASDELDKMSAETLASVGAAEKLTAEIRSQEKVLHNLKKGYADFVIAGDESSDEARRLAREINSLSGDLNQNKQRLANAERSADALGDALTEAGRDAERSSGGYTVLKDALGDLVSDGIKQAMDAFKELALESDTALSKLEARTGATGAKMAGFEDVLNEVYNANYGESMGAVSEALSTVIQMTGELDNASLSQITKNAITLEDVFGYDVTESMRAVNSLTKQFGISSDEAFNLVVQGAQQGLDQNGDLLDTINEYSVQFKNAGYSANDMFNMLKNGTSEGTWSVDKLGDAVKEFNIRMSDGTANEYLSQLGLNANSVIAQFNKGGTEAQAAIGKVMQALSECDNETLQYQAGVGLMGTMYEDLGADAVQALMQTQGAINSTNAAMQQVDTAAYDNLGSSLSALGRTISGEILQPIVGLLTPGLQQLVNFITANVAPTVDRVVKAISDIGGGEMWGQIMSIVSQAGAIISPILKTVASLFGNIGLKVAELLPPIINLVATGIMPLVRVMAEKMQPVIKFVANLLTSALGAAVTTLKPVINSLTSAFQGLITFITGVFAGNWKNAWSGVVSTFGSLWSGLKGLVKTPINAVIGLVNGAISSLNKISVNIPDWVPKFGGQKFGINIPKIPMLATGGFTDGVSIAGEAGMEAVISFDKAYRAANIGIWEKAGEMLGVLRQPTSGGLTSKAGELLTLDNFSLGSLSDNNNIVIYYDFSGFTWSPRIEANGSSDKDDLMARLKAHEAEFFDWLEEFIQMREVAQFA